MRACVHDFPGPLARRLSIVPRSPCSGEGGAGERGGAHKVVVARPAQVGRAEGAPPEPPVGVGGEHAEVVLGVELAADGGRRVRQVRLHQRLAVLPRLVDARRCGTEERHRRGGHGKCLPPPEPLRNPISRCRIQRYSQLK